MKRMQRGQALLIVLLSLAVVLTVGLSVVSRSITDISLTSKEEESLRAFSAAEAGVERALIIGQDTGLTTLGDAKFSATITGALAGPTYVIPDPLKPGDSSIIWFVDQIDLNGDQKKEELGCAGSATCFTGNTLKFCWGDIGTIDANTPAIEIAVFYANTPLQANIGNYSSVRVARAAIDPNNSRAQTPPNYFDNTFGTGCTIGNKNFAFSKTINLSSAIPNGLGIACAATTKNCLQFARVTLLYNNVAHFVGVDTEGNNLPAQGLKVQSSGSSGDANRKIEVIQDRGGPPPIFDGIYSPPGLTR